MANQTNESLDAVQIKHWVTAVKNGQSPTIADKKEKTVKKLPLPLARSDGNGLTFTCEPTTKLMNDLGGNVKLILLPGARHGFDREYQGSNLVRDIVIYEKCDITANADTQQFEIKGKPATGAEVGAYLKECASKGSWYQGDSSSKWKAQKVVTESVEQYLKF